MTSVKRTSARRGGLRQESPRQRSPRQACRGLEPAEETAGPGLETGVKRGSLARAFTLVELLVVIAIIGLLLAIAIPSLNHARQQARTTSMGATLRAIDTALEQFNLDFNRYPRSAQRAQMTTEGPVDVMVGGVTPLDPAAFNDDDAVAADDNDYGPQLLAQALFGLDTLGYVDPDGQQPNQGTADDWYDIRTDTRRPYVERAGLYLAPDAVEIGHANEATLGLDAENNPLEGNGNPILLDIFGRQGQERPILYFRAMRRGTLVADERDSRIAPVPNQPFGIYNRRDCQFFFLTGTRGEDLSRGNPDAGCPGATPLDSFQNALWNYETATGGCFTALTARPYNPQRFILWSGGNDQVFGTEDDVFNFQNDWNHK